MTNIRRITKRDDPTRLALLAAGYEALLVEALDIARRRASRARRTVREILASATVEGLASRINAKAAAVNYRVPGRNGTWHTLIPWQNLKHTTAAEEAESILETVELNLRMEETDSWPKLPRGRSRSKRKR